MFVFGNSDLLKEHSPFWATVLSKFEESDRVVRGIPIVCERHPSTRNLITDAAAFKVYAPDSGCLEPCDFKMACGASFSYSTSKLLPKSQTTLQGHTCSSKCHPDDPMVRYRYAPNSFSHTEEVTFDLAHRHEMPTALHSSSTVWPSLFFILRRNLRALY